MDFEEYEIGACSQHEADMMFMAGNAHRTFHEWVKKIPDYVELPDGRKLNMSCEAGCSYCCSIQVTASVSEILAIVGYIKTLPLETQHKLADRTKSALSQAMHKDVEARSSQRVKCPMLNDDGKCEIYVARPLTCRAYVSYDKDGCQKGANPFKTVDPGIPQSSTLFQYRDDILIQLYQHEKSQGLPFGDYELIQAFNIILDIPDSLTRILAGERILDAALASQ